MSEGSAEAARLASPPPSRRSASETLSTVARKEAGEGPPNPLCMSIFPPSWRLDDWYVGAWLMQMADYDPVLGVWFWGFWLCLSVLWLCLICVFL